jgi:hypothetical protein
MVPHAAIATFRRILLRTAQAWLIAASILTAISSTLAPAEIRHRSEAKATTVQLVLAFLQVIKKCELASLKLWLVSDQASELPELVVWPRVESD